MQNLVVFMDPSLFSSDVSEKVANKCLNRFSIDEDTSFELSGVYYFKSHVQRTKKGTYNPLIIPIKKELFDKQVIDSAFKKIVESKTKHMDTHFVFAGRYYLMHHDKLKSFILKGMENYNIKKVMVTIMDGWREKIITMEKMVSYCTGEEYLKESVNDDIDNLFENIRLGIEPDAYVATYFLPMLTENELKLVEEKNSIYLKTFLEPNPDVKEAEMKLSGSDSKFVYTEGYRRTFAIEFDIDTSHVTRVRRSFRKAFSCWSSR